MKRFLPIALVVAPVALLYLFGALDPVERSRTDWQFRLTERKAQAGVVVVEIDPESLHRLGIWPWPRGYHATVLERLLDAGAERVGLDIDFSSRSVAGEDAELAKAIAASNGRVVLPVFRRWQESEPDKQHLAVAAPLPRFAKNAVLAGINVRPESDGLVRRYDNSAHFLDGTVPSFASALAGGLAGGDVQDFYIDYSIAHGTIPRLSYVDVLTGQFDPAQVRGKAVIVGATAVELGDQIAVPVAAAMPGPLVQALAYESLVQDRALQRADRGVTLAVALLIALLLWRRFEAASWKSGLLVTVGLAVVALVAAGAVEQLSPVMLDVVPWIATVTGLYGLSLVRRIDEQALGLIVQRLRIRRTESLMRHVVQSSFDAIVTFDDTGHVRTFNQAAERMFGYTQVEAAGRPFTELVVHSEATARGSLLVQATGSRIEAAGRSRDDVCFPVELVVTAIDSEDTPTLVAVLRDITERKAHQEELRYRATHNPLTELPNRVKLVDHVEIEMAAARIDGSSFAVLVIDLDKFKEINDVLGHSTGDDLLKVVAQRFGRTLRSSDMLAHLGGDEFAVLLPGTTTEQAQMTAERLIECLGTAFDVEGFALEVDASIGITIFPDHGDQAVTLLQRADVAMYLAKARRCGRMLYDHEQGRKRVRDMTIRGDLREAIENGRLRLAYQPQIRADTQEVVSVEALVRWHHPTHGFIPPDEFIGLAEYSGLIHPLTRWVISTALDQSVCWRRQGTPMGVSVNVSARCLLEDYLVDGLGGMLSSRGVRAEDLTIEITESVIMEDPDKALRNVTRLRELGVNLSVDDFGTGYSSLAYLAELPVQELKIDKSFVMQMDRDKDAATIVRSIVELAHNLGLVVVAEGVESAEIWDELRGLGCDLGQGYHFSKAVFAEELTEVLRALTPLPALAADVARVLDESMGPAHSG